MPERTTLGERLVLAAALLIFALVALAALGSVWGGCHDPNRQPDAQRQNHEIENCEYDGIALFAADASGFFHTYHDDVTALSTAFIAAFTIVLALVTGRQARLTKGLADATAVAAIAARDSTALAAREFEIIERPRLYMIEFKGEYLDTPPAGRRFPPDKIKPGIEIEYHIANYGRTPATMEEINIDVAGLVECPPEPVYRRERVSRAGLVISPTRPQEGHIFITEDERWGHPNRREQYGIIVFGYVIYSDINGVRYQRGFGLQFMNDRPGAFYFYGKGESYNYDRKISDPTETT